MTGQIDAGGPASDDAGMPATGLDVARRYFERAAAGDIVGMARCIHPEAVLVPVDKPEQEFDREGFVRFVERTGAMKSASTLRDVDERRVVVSGQVRWPLPGGGHRHSDAHWAIVVRDGLLYREWPTESIEAAIDRLTD